MMVKVGEAHQTYDGARPQHHLASRAAALGVVRVPLDIRLAVGAALGAPTGVVVCVDEARPHRQYGRARRRSPDARAETTNRFSERCSLGRIAVQNRVSSLVSRHSSSEYRKRCLDTFPSRRPGTAPLLDLTLEAASRTQLRPLGLQELPKLDEVFHAPVGRLAVGFKRLVPPVDPRGPETHALGAEDVKLVRGDVNDFGSVEAHRIDGLEVDAPVRLVEAERFGREVPVKFEPIQQTLLENPLSELRVGNDLVTHPSHFSQAPYHPPPAIPLPPSPPNSH